MNRKVNGVSELLAALLLITITLAGFGLVTATVAPRFANQGQSVIDMIHQNQVALGQMATIIYATHAYGQTTYVYIYNFGDEPITPQIIFLNGTPYIMSNVNNVWNSGVPFYRNPNHFTLMFLNYTPTDNIPPHTVAVLVVNAPQGSTMQISMLTNAGQIFSWTTPV